MEIKTFIEMIQQAGVPVMVIAFYMYKEYKKDGSITEAINKFTTAIEVMNERITSIEANCNRNIDTAKELIKEGK